MSPSFLVIVDIFLCNLSHRDTKNIGCLACTLSPFHDRSVGVPYMSLLLDNDSKWIGNLTKCPPWTKLLALNLPSSIQIRFYIAAATPLYFFLAEFHDATAEWVREHYDRDCKPRMWLRCRNSNKGNDLRGIAIRTDRRRSMWLKISYR